MTFDRVTIVAGGSSISEGVEKQLWDKIKDECVITTNYAYKFFPNSTFLCFVDFSFFSQHKTDLRQLPLIITKNSMAIQGLVKNENFKNIILLPESRNKYFGETSFKDGVYSPKLVGLFALTIAIQLGFKNIFLLGYDFGAINGSMKTHFYEGQINHRGVGFKIFSNQTTHELKHKTILYDKNPDNYFDCYKPELQRIKIFNVSPNSKINTFPKITYDEYFDILNKNKQVIDQEKARIEILNIIAQKTQKPEEQNNKPQEPQKIKPSVPIRNRIVLRPHKNNNLNVNNNNNNNSNNNNLNKKSEQQKANSSNNTQELKPEEEKFKINKIPIQLQTPIIENRIQLPPNIELSEQMRPIRTANERGLYRLIRFLSQQGKKTMVEIGCWAGESTFMFAQVFDNVYAIDLWDTTKFIKGNKNFLEKIKIAEKIFDYNLSNYPNVKKIKRDGYKEYFNFEDNSLDFVYIDTHNDEESIEKLISLWTPKIKIGGYIGGHDFIQDNINNEYSVANVVIKKFGKPNMVFPDKSWIVEKLN